MWLGREEEAFNRTLEQGMRLLNDVVARARENGEEGIGADQAFLLHDTYGFPFDLTLELAAEQGLGVDEQGFEELMQEQRERARSSAGRGGGRDAERERIQAFAEASDPTTFTGYETLEQATAVGALSRENGKVLAKLVESPFYATGGGQVADHGVVECADGDCRARVVDVVRLGDDQALVLEPLEGELHEGERVIARVDPERRLTERNHTATHLLHAALRERLGIHVRQAGSYVGPDKLRFDFTHGAPLTEQEVRDVEDMVNAQIIADHPVRALTTTLDEARSLGAMALFGEKYGDVVRMVEIGDGNWSRELCGGTHVRSTGVIGVLKITTETSSAANVRRIEAITGEVAIDELRRHDRVLAEAARVLRTSPDQVAGDRRRPRGQAPRAGEAVAAGGARRRVVRDRRARRHQGGVRDQAGRQPQGAARPRRPDQEPARRPGGGRPRRARRRPRDADRGGDARRGRARREGRRGHQGGGAGRRRRRWRPRQHGPGGRTRAGEAAGRAGRRRARRSSARSRLSSMRVLALDYGAARCGVAVSDPTGTLATPLEPVLRPGTKNGLKRLVAIVHEVGAERVVVGPAGRLRGGDSAQTRETRQFADRLERAVERSRRALRRALHHVAGAAGRGRGVAGFSRRGDSSRRMAEGPASSCR